MLSLQNIFDTIAMVDKQHLDIRTITMGISLLDCADEDMDRCCGKIYDKICSRAEKLVQTGCDIESEFGIPIVNKRISVTPIAIAGAACKKRGLRPPGPDAGPRRQDLRRQLHRRLLRPGAEGLYLRRPAAHRLHSRGAGPHGAGLLQRQRGQHQGRHQHGRRGPDGPRHQGRRPT